MLFLIRLKILLQSKYFIKLVTVLTLIFSILFTYFYHFESKYKEKDNYFIGIVDKYKIKDNYLIIELLAKERLIIKYKIENDVNINYGDKLLVEGFLEKPKRVRIPNTFDYSKYLYNNKIYYIVNANSIKKVKNPTNCIYIIKNLIISRTNNLLSSKYLNNLLLGVNNNNNYTNYYRKIGISHLFSISGMHISIIISFLYYYLDRVSYNKRLKFMLVSLFLILYYLLVKSPSLLRSIVMFNLFNINKIYKMKIKKLDLILLTLAISLFLNPFLIYNSSFIYSYLISSFIVLFYKKSKYNYLRFNIFIFIITIPLNIYYNYQVNVISIISNLILVPFFTFLIFPLALLTFLFSFLDSIFLFFINIFNYIVIFLSKFNITIVIFSKISILVLILYYFIIINAFKNNNYFYIFVILLAFNYFYPYINNKLYLTVFDVGSGDSILLKFPYNKKNILIDTGKSKSLMENNIIAYLKSLGIKKLDYVIITHGDLDHIGGLDSLLTNFNVDHVILNKGNFNNYEKEIINKYKDKIVKKDKLKVDNSYIYFLETGIYDNENDNSIITYFKYNKYKFLFMGDASKKVEKKLIEKYNLSNITFLKVGHHGSDTSSGFEFINNITPKICLLSVGINNRYGHPKKAVLNTLKDYCKIYRTDTNGSIILKIK